MSKRIMIIILLIVFSNFTFASTIIVEKGNDKFQVEGKIEKGRVYFSFEDIKKIMKGESIDNYITVLDENERTVRIVKKNAYNKNIKMKVGETYGYDGILTGDIKIEGDNIYEIIDDKLIKFIKPGNIKIYENEKVLINIEVVPLIKGEKIKGPIKNKMVLKSGDYVIENDLLIESSGKLIFEDGVRINVKNGSRIKVFGNIESIGKNPTEFYYDPLVKSGNIIIEGSNVSLKNIDFKGINKNSQPFIEGKGRIISIENCSFTGDNLNNSLISLNKYGNKINDTKFYDIITNGENLIEIKSYDGDSFIKSCTFDNVVDKSTFGENYLLTSVGNSLVMECDFNNIRNLSGISNFNKVNKCNFSNFSSIKSIGLIKYVDHVSGNNIENVLYRGNVDGSCIVIDGCREVQRNKLKNINAEYSDDRSIVIGIKCGRSEGRILENELDNCFIGIKTDARTTRKNIVNNCTYPFMSFRGSGYITISKNEYNSGDIYDIEKDIDLKRIRISRWY